MTRPAIRPGGSFLAAFFSLVLIGCSSTGAPTPTSGTSLTTAQRTPLETRVVRTDVSVNLDRDLLAVEDSGQADDVPPQQVSTDGGATWSRAAIPRVATVGYAADRRVTYADADSIVHTYDFAGATVTGSTKVSRGTLAAIGRDYLVSFDTEGTSESEPPTVLAVHSQNLGDGTVRTLDYTGRQQDSMWEVHASAGAGDSVLVASFGFTTGVLDVLPLDGGRAMPALEVPALRAADVRGDQAVYVTGSKTATELCLRSFAGGAWAEPTCAALDSIAVWNLGVDLRVGADWAAVKLWHSEAAQQADQPIEYVVWGSDTPSTVQRVAAVGGARTRLVGRGASAAPLVSVGSDASGYVARLAPDGSAARAFGFIGAGVPFSVRRLVAAPDRVVALDVDPDPAVRDRLGWSRPVAGAGFGEATPMPAVADTVDASAGRALLGTADGLLVLDHGTVVRNLGTADTLRPQEGTLSGPYYIPYSEAGGEVLRVDGVRVYQRPEHTSLAAVFGSLAVLTGIGSGPFRVVDMTDPERSWTFALPKGWDPAGARPVGLWGDWVLVRQIASDDGVFRSAVVNYRTGANHVIDQENPRLIGDGFVLFEPLPAFYRRDQGLALWDFTTGEVQQIAADGSFAAATDGSHWLAYATATELALEPLTGFGRSAPRTLGVVVTGPASAGGAWTFELDATKALGAGTLVIARSGSVVRTLPTAAAPDGSVRASWDGSDDAGRPVASGAYTWEFTAAATDGTGSLVQVDGSAGVTGTLDVG